MREQFYMVLVWTEGGVEFRVQRTWNNKSDALQVAKTYAQAGYESGVFLSDALQVAKTYAQAGYESGVFLIREVGRFRPQESKVGAA